MIIAPKSQCVGCDFEGPDGNSSFLRFGQSFQEKPSHRENFSGRAATQHLSSKRRL
jgi:hypothetical protein